MKSIAWTIREIFKMLNKYAVDIPTLPVNRVFPTSSSSCWNAKPFFGDAEPQKWAAKHLGPHGLSGNVFANPAASSSALYPQELNPWSSNISEPTSPHMMSEKQTPVQDQRYQSGP